MTNISCETCLHNGICCIQEHHANNIAAHIRMYGCDDYENTLHYHHIQLVIGQTVYYVNKRVNKIVPVTIASFAVYPTAIGQLATYYFTKTVYDENGVREYVPRCIDDSNIGKDIFLTEIEAKNALAKSTNYQY